MLHTIRRTKFLGCAHGSNKYCFSFCLNDNSDCEWSRRSAGRLFQIVSSVGRYKQFRFESTFKTDKAVNRLRVYNDNQQRQQQQQQRQQRRQQRQQQRQQRRQQ